MFTFEDDRYAALQSLLQMEDMPFIPDPTIRPGINQYRDVFLYIFQLSVLDRMFVPRSVSSTQDDAAEDSDDAAQDSDDAAQDSLPTHVRVNKLESSCKVRSSRRGHIPTYEPLRL